MRINRISRQSREGFTLLEILTATTIFSIILVIALSILGQSISVWKRSSNKIQSFQDARRAYSLISASLSQATLKTYLDYVDASDNFPSDTGYTAPPVRYARRSDLQMVTHPSGTSGFPGTVGTGVGVYFQFPSGFEGSSGGTKQYVGMSHLLNTCGFYVEFADDTTRPGFVSTTPKYRYRLMQLLVPTQNNLIYDASDGAPAHNWFKNFAASDSHPVADNIIALVILPQDPDEPIDYITPDYVYDSRLDEKDDPQPVTANQLPPAFQVVMIAIDEDSAMRMETGSAEPSVISTALAGKFVDVTELQQDISAIESALIDANIQYRTFTNSVAIRESKWSK
jgi:uncharacterized protein (TIGR02599 family)